MIKGLYSAATGMIALEAQQAVTANNIANAATPGFRRQEPLIRGFYDIFLDEFGTVANYQNRVGPGGGVQFEETYTDTRSGTLITTGNPMNMALEGPGFFAVQTGLGERFTRNGSFSVDVDGQLATPDGHKVLGAGGGFLDVGDGRFEVGTDGTVRVEGEVRGELRIVEFEDPHMLQRQGENLYFANEDAMDQSAEAANTRVIGKSIEGANVQVPVELTNMLLGLRAYSANQQVITTLSETMSRVIDQVGSPT